jgi:uncharacterized metal-binding protein YceD (DUF177 family)
MTPWWLRILRRIVYCRRGHQWIYRTAATKGTWYLECTRCLTTTTSLSRR